MFVFATCINYEFIILFLVLQAYYVSWLITKHLTFSFGHEDYLTNRNEQTQTLDSKETLCFQDNFSYAGLGYNLVGVLDSDLEAIRVLIYHVYQGSDCTSRKVLFCQPRVEVTSCFVYKVMGLTFHEG